MLQSPKVEYSLPWLWNLYDYSEQEKAEAADKGELWLWPANVFPPFWLHRNQSVKTYLNLTAVWFGIFRNQASQRENTELFPHRVKIPALQWRQPWSCCFYWVPRNWPWTNAELITDNKQTNNLWAGRTPRDPRGNGNQVLLGGASSL